VKEDREHALANLVKRQHGVVARDQLLALGFSGRTIDFRVTTQRLWSVHQGVYATSPLALSAAGRQAAALLAIRPDPLLSHDSSVARQGLIKDGSIVHVSISTRVPRRLDGVIVHRPRRIDPDDRVQVDGFPMTSLPRTFLDLGQTSSYPRLQKIIEEADRTERLDIRAVEEVIDRYPGHRGRRPLRRIVSDYLWTPDANEGIERDFQVLLSDFGLPTPHANVVVEGLTVDCWWPASRFVVELDSKGWHKTWEAHERDRKRDAVLLRAGISSLRITHRRIHKERAEVAADVRAGLRLPPLPAGSS
jgi:hypothetical protein